MIQYILQRNNICLADLALGILEVYLSTLQCQSKKPGPVSLPGTRTTPWQLRSQSTGYTDGRPSSC